MKVFEGNDCKNVFEGIVAKKRKHYISKKLEKKTITRWKTNMRGKQNIEK